MGNTKGKARRIWLKPCLNRKAATWCKTCEQVADTTERQGTLYPKSNWKLLKHIGWCKQVCILKRIWLQCSDQLEGAEWTGIKPRLGGYCNTCYQTCEELALGWWRIMKSRWIQKIIRFAKKTYVHRLKSLKLELMVKRNMFFGVSGYIAKLPWWEFFFICKLLCICSTAQNF